MATSTSSAAPNAPNLIASTTVATSTTILLDHLEHPGSSGMTSFLWGAGEYILGLAGAQYPQYASSTDWDAAAGEMYITCHTR